MLIVEVAANPELLELDLARASALRCPDQRVIDGMMELRDVCDISAKFAGERLAIEHGEVLAIRPIEPREVSECEWLVLALRVGNASGRLRDGLHKRER